MTLIIAAPFPYFGGKSNVADLVWSRLGSDVGNYVEPFFGSGAVLLARPDWLPERNNTETVNDKSGFIANAWRAIQADPEQTAHYADQPVNENDLHARHIWLLNKAADLDLPARLEGAPDYFDAKIAGWWIWGACCWIGSGWCRGNGPWQSVDGLMTNAQSGGVGVNRQLPHLGDKGRGVNKNRDVYGWFDALSERLRGVRVCCGDWSRVCGPTPTFHHGITGIFLDPPYTADAGRNRDLYEQDSLTVGHDVAAWCKANQDNRLLRLALCGYEGEYELPGWDCVKWKAHGGFGSQGDGAGRENATRERIWFSPHCLPPANRQMALFNHGWA